MARPGSKKYNDPRIEHVDTDTWYRIRQRLTTVKILCADGATNAQIAKYLGVSVYTIVTYRQRYPEFNECFIQGRQEVIDKLEGKLYQSAMGIVDKDITRVVTKEVTEEVEDQDTGEISEVVKTRTTRTNIKEMGIDSPDTGSIQFMLRNLAPEKYNVQPVKGEDGIEPIKVIDDISSAEDSETDKLFYDDSQDSPDGCSYKDVTEDAGKSK